MLKKMADTFTHFHVRFPSPSLFSSSLSSACPPSLQPGKKGGKGRGGGGSGGGGVVFFLFVFLGGVVRWVSRRARKRLHAPLRYLKTETPAASAEVLYDPAVSLVVLEKEGSLYVCQGWRRGVVVRVG